MLVDDVPLIGECVADKQEKLQGEHLRPDSRSSSLHFRFLSSALYSTEREKGTDSLAPLFDLASIHVQLSYPASNFEASWSWKLGVKRTRCLDEPVSGFRRSLGRRGKGRDRGRRPRGCSLKIPPIGIRCRWHYFRTLVAVPMPLRAAIDLAFRPTAFLLYFRRR